MARSLVTTEALRSFQILDLYKHLRISLSELARQCLSARTGKRLTTNGNNELIFWRPDPTKYRPSKKDFWDGMKVNKDEEFRVNPVEVFHRNIAPKFFCINLPPSTKMMLMVDLKIVPS
ncbi:unnamed protein product [Caenorhabditis sp. 36 PRJEB53466]|nr:unnamed protein product [Caenorhabditis sp. 36 PRJEB53466]